MFSSTMTSSGGSPLKADSMNVDEAATAGRGGALFSDQRLLPSAKATSAGSDVN